MKKPRILIEEKGSALPIVTLLLIFIILGICALVFDAGLLYSERRNMVTAADAAALAGATIMRDDLTDDTITEDASKINAESIAQEIALSNGVNDVLDVDISWANADYSRKTITVTVKNTKTLFFARFLGYENTEVAARAVATWGYDTVIEGGDILPIFAKDKDFTLDDNTIFKDDKLVVGDKSTGNWGLLDIGSGINDVKTAFEGNNIGIQMSLSTTLTSQPGNANAIVDSIQERMKKANLISLKEDRIKFMCGLVPVIDWDAVNKDGNGHNARLELPIKYFAVFEIYDVITDNDGNGSEFELYKSSDYKYTGNKINYGSGLNRSTIIGRFRDDLGNGGQIDVRTIVTDGDQTRPSVITDTYSKLIE